MAMYVVGHKIPDSDSICGRDALSSSLRPPSVHDILFFRRMSAGFFLRISRRGYRT